MILYHPAHHEALLALREAELARRPRLPASEQPVAPLRYTAAAILRHAANRIDPEGRQVPPATTAPAS
jgi:hypothetical protein